MHKFVIASLVLGLVACSSVPKDEAAMRTQHWVARGTASSLNVPTAEQLFLVGTFNLRANFINSLLGKSENHYGHELDLSFRRPVLNLENTVFDAKYGKSDYKLIANFYYRGNFYIARVPNDGVENIYFTLSYFPPTLVAAHTYMRFQMKEDKPVELVALMPDVTQLQQLSQAPDGDKLGLLAPELNGDTYRLQNVAISAEAQWTKDDPKKAYDLKRGKEGAFIQIARFEAMEERLAEFYDGGNISKQIRFDPARGHFDDILAAGLKMSQSDGLTKFYDTALYNCTTFAFAMIEIGQGSHDPRLGIIRSEVVEDRFPVLAPDKVKVYGTLPGTIILHEDATLKNESYAAYEREVLVPKRPVCPLGMGKVQCAHIQDGIAFIHTYFPQ